MHPTRLFILGALARRGPMHGHQIRREAQVDRTERWAEVKPGSLYAALKRMATEGVIEVVRVEQEGNMPPRTVYAINAEGRAELHALRDELLGHARLRPDPVDLALQYVDDLSKEHLVTVIQERHQKLAVQLSEWERLLVDATPYLSGLEPVTYQHTLIRLRAELDWHAQLLEVLRESSDQ